MGVVYSITSPFTVGGFSSAMAELAGPELLTRASAFDATSLNVGVIVGPIVAGGVAGAAGPAVAVGVQVAVKLIVALLIAVNPAFAARSHERIPKLRQALADGTRALFRTPVLRAAVLGSAFSNSSWSLMAVGFPLYAVQLLGAPAHDSGYLWAALGVGSIVGTFALKGEVSLRRNAIAYVALGASALLWLAAGELWVGVALVTLSGVCDGPCFSGSIALRQRHTPPALRAQVSTTAMGLMQLTTSTLTAVGGVIADPVVLIFGFLVLNLVAAGITGAAARSQAGGSKLEFMPSPDANR